MIGMLPGSRHRPPPDEVVRSLTDAGVSFDTARAMEGWKAREVLELLNAAATARPPHGEGPPAHGRL